MNPTNPAQVEEAEGRPSLGLRQIAVWVFSALVFVLTLEVSIRVEDRLRWDAPMVGAYSHDGLFAADSIGWHPKAGARYQKWAINDFGFRGPDITRAPTADVVRVVVMGSSETFGQAESADHEFPRALERSLNEGGSQRFEVINAGIPGMSVARMSDYWTRWVSGFEPDVVVVYPSPSFYLSDDVPPDVINPASAPPPPLEDGSRLLPSARQAVNRFLPEWLQADLKRFLIARTVSSQPEGWVWDTVPSDRLEAYRRHNEELVSALQNAGVSVVLATHADAIDLPLDSTEEVVLIGWRKFHPRALGEVILEFEVEANAALVDIGDRAGVPVVRIDQLVPADPSLFSDNEHFTDAGAEMVAAGLVDAVRSSVSR